MDVGIILLPTPQGAMIGFQGRAAGRLDSETRQVHGELLLLYYTRSED